MITRPLRAVVRSSPKWRYREGQVCDWFIEAEYGHHLLREQRVEPPRRVRCEGCDPMEPKK